MQVKEVVKVEEMILLDMKLVEVKVVGMQMEVKLVEVKGRVENVVVVDVMLVGYVLVLVLK